jgi:acetyl esterase/lipase
VTVLAGGGLVDLPPDVVEEAHAFNRQAELLVAGLPQVHELGVEASRAANAATAPPPSSHAETRVVDGVPVRILRPDAVHGVYLHVHGGGWTMGGADLQDPHLWALAEAASVAVVSVDYRLAPEHPFPAALDDCEAVACWLVEHAGAELGCDRLAIGGESAGAHLSVLTLLRLRDRHGLRNRFAGANLVYGLYDLSMTPSQRQWGDRNLVLSAPTIAWHLDQLLPGIDREARRSPDISPLYADLADLAPALFTVGTVDPLYDDSVFLAARWQASGNPATLEVYEGGIHAFNLFPTRLAEHSNRSQHAFVRDAIGA